MLQHFFSPQWWELERCFYSGVPAPRPCRNQNLTASASDLIPSFQLDVLVNGRPLPEYYARGRTYVEALQGAEYELRVRNPSADRVAVALSVDGLNTIDARHTSAWNASKWVIEPYQTITISGWQMSSERARRFYFTNERDSYGAKLGQTANLGVISAVFFRERRRVIPITPSYRRDSESEQSMRPGKHQALSREALIQRVIIAPWRPSSMMMIMRRRGSGVRSETMCVGLIWIWIRDRRGK